MNVYASLLYAMVILWTGIQRSIDAQAFKPNAFWFCTFVSFLAILYAYLFRLKFPRLAKWFGGVGGGLALAFYVYCFMVQPEQDANLRVGVAIVASLGYVSLILLPMEDATSTKN